MDLQTASVALVDCKVACGCVGAAGAVLAAEPCIAPIGRFSMGTVQGFETRIR
jgi:hypothetical protein